jgi:hypothetical protein
MTPEEVIEFKKQVERTDAYTEQECAKYLVKDASALLSTKYGIITYLNCEQICSAGRLDIIVIAEMLEVGGSTRNCAFVWELKAPQLPLFQLETNNQACPSSELFLAENQLLHYHHSIANDGHYRDRWNIVSPDDVKFGGIIIGRDNAIVKCKEKEITLGKQLATQALRIRESIFYRAYNIRVLTWDWIIKSLESSTVSHQKYTGKSDATIDVRGSAELTIPALIVSISGEAK